MNLWVSLEDFVNKSYGTFLADNGIHIEYTISNNDKKKKTKLLFQSCETFSLYKIFPKNRKQKFHLLLCPYFIHQLFYTSHDLFPSVLKHLSCLNSPVFCYFYLHNCFFNYRQFWSPSVFLFLIYFILALFAPHIDLLPQ